MSEQTEPLGLDTLPRKVLFRILENLDHSDLKYRMRRVSKYFHNLLSSPLELKGSPSLRQSLFLDIPTHYEDLKTTHFEVHPIISMLNGSILKEVEDLLVKDPLSDLPFDELPLTDDQSLSNSDQIQWKFSEVSAKDENLFTPDIPIGFTVECHMSMGYDLKIEADAPRPITVSYFMNFFFDSMKEQIKEVRKIWPEDSGSSSKREDECLGHKWKEDEYHKSRSEYDWFQFALLKKDISHRKYMWNGIAWVFVVDPKDKTVHVCIEPFGYDPDPEDLARLSPIH